jgi:hypothetical protein
MTAGGGMESRGSVHTHMRQMLKTHPRPSEQFDEEALLDCIEACADCAQVCFSCADACLGEDKVAELVKCIRLNLDCADVCDTTGRILSRQTEPDEELIRAQLEACMQACRVCAEECEKHAEHHEHCAVCAESCRSCERACERLLGEAA